VKKALLRIIGVHLNFYPTGSQEYSNFDFLDYR